jgi:hypothetical protein
VEKMREEERLIRELEKENKRAIPLLRIIYLRWLKRNLVKDIYKHIITELNYLEIAN